MWVEREGLTQIGVTVERRQADQVDHLLRDLYTDAGSRITVPVGCPHCGRDLVRQPIGIGQLFVSACPDGHGAWLTPEIATMLRELVGEHAARLRRRRTVLLRTLVASLGILVAVVATAPGQQAIIGAVRRVSDRVENGRLSETHWPVRQWPGTWPIPLKESRIDTHAELLYFQRLLELLDAGISNRLNMEGVLALSRAPERYIALYEVYRARQAVVLDELRRLDVPARLSPFHERIVIATEWQIAFYGDYAKLKAQEPGADLARVLAHPALQEANRVLLEAWDQIGVLYPDLDQPTRDAVYNHLCGFDII